MAKNMTDRNPDKPKDATEIFLGVQRNRAGVEEWEDYKSFVEASPENAAEQQQLKALWNDARGLSMDLMPSDEELASDTYDGSETVAAHNAKQQVPLRNEIGAVEKLMDGVNNFMQSLQLRPAVSFAAFAAVAVATVSFWPTANTYSTTTSEHRRVALEDGSSILLGAESSVTVDYSGSERAIALHGGEAYFDVAKDADRPFIVDVAGLQVQAVGTAFNILSAPDDVTVSVTEGIVRVDTSLDAENNTSAMLEIGDELEVSLVDQQFTQREEDPTHMLFWQNEVLYFRGEQLKDIFYRIDRYTDQSVEFSDAAIGELLFSGSVNRSNIDGWLNSLPLAFPVKIERVENRVIVSSSDG